MIQKLALALLVILVSAALVWYFQEAVLDIIERGQDAAIDETVRPDAERAPGVKKTLYFASSEEDALVPYPVEVEIGKNKVDTLRNVLAALIAGPEREGYAPVIPKGVRLRAAFPGPEGIAYVDFDESLRDAHPGGIWAELMTAYGVANTVIGNFPDLYDRVVLLIGGQEALSIAGSFAITGPLKAREELITNRVPGPAAREAPEAAQGADARNAASANQEPPASAVGVPAGNLPSAGGAPLAPVGLPEKKPGRGRCGRAGKLPLGGRYAGPFGRGNKTRPRRGC